MKKFLKKFLITIDRSKDGAIKFKRLGITLQNQNGD